MHNELLVAENLKERVWVHFEQSISQVPSAAEREMSLILSVRGLSPVVSRSKPIISAEWISSATASNWSRVIIRYGGPVIVHFSDHDNFDNLSKL